MRDTKMTECEPANYEILWDDGRVSNRESFQFLRSAELRFKELRDERSTFSACLTDEDGKILREFDR
jgi:hypothetical protein